MIRVADWPEILARHIAAARSRAFEWGVHDCCVFACDGVLAMTGIDPMAVLRGAYDDAVSAALALKIHAGGGLPEAADALARDAGLEAIAPGFAQRGDVLLADILSLHGKRAWALGLVAPDGRGAFAAPVGLTFLPIRAATRAWRI